MKILLEASKSNPSVKTDPSIAPVVIERIMLLDVSRDISNILFQYPNYKHNDALLIQRVQARILDNFHNKEQATSCGKLLISSVTMMDVDIIKMKAIVALEFFET
jgi:hypothetical protein